MKEVIYNAATLRGRELDELPADVLVVSRAAEEPSLPWKVADGEGRLLARFRIKAAALEWAQSRR